MKDSKQPAQTGYPSSALRFITTALPPGVDTCVRTPSYQPAEAWMIFAIGNIHPLLALTYPHCFGDAQPPQCSQGAAASVTYIEVLPLQLLPVLLLLHRSPRCCCRSRHRCCHCCRRMPVTALAPVNAAVRHHSGHAGARLLRRHHRKKVGQQVSGHEACWEGAAAWYMVDCGNADHPRGAVAAPRVTAALALGSPPPRFPE